MNPATGDVSNSRPSRKSNWAGILVIACLALGFTASALEYERATVQSERDRAEALATLDSKIEGRLEDLGKFLAEPQTRLIRLSSLDSSAPQAVIAWNSSLSRGYLLCDRLPTLDSQVDYEVWAIHGSDAPIQLADFNAMAGVSVYPLQAVQEIDEKDQLEITAGPRSAGKSPMFRSLPE